MKYVPLTSLPQILFLEGNLTLRIFEDLYLDIVKRLKKCMARRASVLIKPLGTANSKKRPSR